MMRRGVTNEDRRVYQAVEPGLAGREKGWNLESLLSVEWGEEASASRVRQQGAQHLTQDH